VKTKIFLFLFSFIIFFQFFECNAYGLQKPSHGFAQRTVEGDIYLGWRMDKDYVGNIGFGYNIFRKGPGESQFSQVNTNPIVDSTNYSDRPVGDGLFVYHICAHTDADGNSDPLEVSVEVRGPDSTEVFLSSGTGFSDAGVWTTMGDGDDGWYIGDYDGDGDADLLEWTAGIGSQVFLSDRTQFISAGIWSTAGTGNDACWYIGDYNGDGKTDLMRRTNGVGNEVFLSDGVQFSNNGVWTGAGTGTDATWYIGDYNGDGKSDLIRRTIGVGNEVFLSDGAQFSNDGVWTGAGTGTDATWYIGDYNGDGKTDIMRRTDGVGNEVFLSDGTQFTNTGVWSGAGTGTDSTWYIGDYNGDGKSDLMRRTTGVGNEVFLSDGVQFVNNGVWSGAGPGPDGWYVGDFNGDSKDDILRYFANVNSMETTNYRTISDATIIDVTSAHMKVGDFNNDGLNDFQVITMPTNTANSATVRIYFNSPSQALLTSPDFVYQLQTTPDGVTHIPWTIWDMNSDGKEDVIGIDKVGNDFKLYILDGETGLNIVPPLTLTSYQSTFVNKNIAVAYLDGEAGNPYIIYNDGIRHFQYRFIGCYKIAGGNLVEIGSWLGAPTGSPEPAFAHQMEVVDVDGDGKDEVIAGSYVFERENSIFGERYHFDFIHPDGVHVGDVIPGDSSRGQEIYFHVESAGGAWLYRGFEHSSTPEHVWHIMNPLDPVGTSDDHADRGWIGNIMESYSGLEPFVMFKDGKDSYYPSYLPAGDANSCILNGNTGNDIKNYLDLRYGPIDWSGDDDGQAVEVVKGQYGGSIIKINGDGSTSTLFSNLPAGYKFVFDVVGDYREEILSSEIVGGALYIKVFTNSQLIGSRKQSPCESRQYMQKSRWAGH
jgi:hypothetical protein